MILERFSTFELKNMIKKMEFDGDLRGLELDVIAELLDAALMQWRDLDIESAIYYLESKLGDIIDKATKEDRLAVHTPWKKLINNDKKSLYIVLDNLYKVKP